VMAFAAKILAEGPLRTLLRGPMVEPGISPEKR
jgi:hypothetical protein